MAYPLISWNVERLTTLLDLGIKRWWATVDPCSKDIAFCSSIFDTMAQPPDEDLQNWSTKVEDLLDDGNLEGAKKLLESIVAKLERRSDATVSLTLAAALKDLGGLYNGEGLAMKAESLFNTASLIRNKAEKLAMPSHQGAGINHSGNEGSCFQIEDGGGGLSTSSVSNYEDWEVFSEDPATLYDQFAATKVSEMSLKDKRPPKQRGRGAFTHGEMGLYSDRPTVSALCDGDTQDDTPAESEGARGHSLDYGAGHVLILDGFQPTVTTKDLEDLFKPFARREVSIRWVNDTRALAVFRNPTIAREALQCTHNPHLKICLLDEDTAASIQLNERDLEPPVPRPATSSQAAQRMIVGALRKQGLSKALCPKNNFQVLQKQEDERKQRLLTRQQLRDEAWGSDD